MIEQLDKEYVLQTYPRNYVNFKRGVNATLFDENEKDYIDFTSGIGVVSVGHGNESVAKKIYEQVSNITHISNLYAIEPQAKLGEKIAKLSKMDVATFFANSGAEANEGAIKLARKYGETKFDNKRYKVITLEHSFHGRTITTVRATGQEAMHTDNFSPYPDGFSYENEIANIYKSIDNETVAVMIELVQGEGGVQPLDKKEVQDLAKFLKEKDILLIIDEVQTGAYRTGEFLATNLYDIQPDIITMAKGLGGGVPIGAVITTHKDLFTYGDHGSTFGGNYLSTAASLEVLDILERTKDSGELDKTISYFENKIESLFQNNKEIFTSTVGIGLMKGLRVKDADTLASILKESFEQGVLLLRAGKNTLRMLPALTITNDEIDEGFKRLENALSKIAK
ncbi:aspartate aminotransferase family protein [Poseidonibacter lekithochrous]|uniref:aspartate aminotransferase family protein n=1 Tax=Poseidonibacter lekithochrous TaxID=1904463 RepID=UPI000D3634FB|nr:aspartate aminotransferase family protein [Poseidonibacter lekithochrous]